MKIFRKVLKVLVAIFSLSIFVYIAMGLMLIHMLATNYGFIPGMLSMVMSFISLYTIIKILTE